MHYNMVMGYEIVFEHIQNVHVSFCNPYRLIRTFCILGLYTTVSSDYVNGHKDPYQSGPEVIKVFSCSVQLSMKFVLLINLKLLTIANSFFAKLD